MALTNYRILNAMESDALERQVLEAAADGFLPYGPATFNDRLNRWHQTMVIGDVAGGYIPPEPADPVE